MSWIPQDILDIQDIQDIRDILDILDILDIQDILDILDIQDIKDIQGIRAVTLLPRGSPAEFITKGGLLPKSVVICPLAITRVADVDAH